MAVPDPEVDSTSNNYIVYIGEGKGVVIGPNARVEQHFYSTPQEPQVDLVAEDILGSISVRELFGPSVRAVKLADVPPASDAEVRQYYEGAPLTWNIIAAHRDVERDLYRELMSSLSTPINRMRVVCLSGEPGSGKSTLAWRLAAEVAQTTQWPLLHMRDNEADEIWYKLEDFFEQYDVPLVVLVDDVFRDYNAYRTLGSLNPNLNITIITTSRSNEMPDDLRLPFPFHNIELSEPTPNEKRRVMERLGLDEHKLKAAQQKRLKGVNSWLVMMMELTAGKELPKIVRESIKRLKQQDEIVYRAYEYLCYAGQYDLAVPETLMAALDDQGHFYNLLEHPSSKGLIFADNVGRGRIRTQHATLAREALKSYRRDPLVLTKEFVRAVQSTESTHRVFLDSLLYTLLLNHQEFLVRNVLEQQALKIETILMASGAGELLYYWAGLYRLLDDRRKVKELEDIVLGRIPETTKDQRAYLGLVKQQGTPEQVAKALDMTTTWLADYPEDYNVRRTYLGLVERRGTPEQIATVLASTTSWLADHPKDYEVRRTYLGLVERQGTPEQVATVLASTTSWLADHPEDQEVRSAYLGLVERRGTPEQMARVFDMISSWLAAHPEDYNVRRTYLGLVKRQGTPEQVATVLDTTTSWLAAHLEDREVRNAYLGLVKRQGTPEQVAKALDMTTTWLAAHLEDREVRRSYLGLVERWGTPEHLEQAFNLARNWFNRNPAIRDTQMLQGYGRILLKLARYQEAEVQFRRVLSIMRSYVPARFDLAWSLYHQEKKTEAYSEFQHAMWWAHRRDDYPIGVALNQLGRYHFLEGDLEKAIQCFEDAILANPDFYGNFWELGRVQLAREQYDLALIALTEAQQRLPVNISEKSRTELEELIELSQARLQENQSAKNGIT